MPARVSGGSISITSAIAVTALRRSASWRSEISGSVTSRTNMWNACGCSCTYWKPAAAAFSIRSAPSMPGCRRRRHEQAEHLLAALFMSSM